MVALRILLIAARKTALRTAGRGVARRRLGSRAERTGFLRDERLQNAIILDFIDRTERLLNGGGGKATGLQVSLYLDFSPLLVEQFVVRKGVAVAGVVEKTKSVEVVDDGINGFRRASPSVEFGADLLRTMLGSGAIRFGSRAEFIRIQRWFGGWKGVVGHIFGIYSELVREWFGIYKGVAGFIFGVGSGVVREI